MVYNPIKVDLKALREVVTAQASAAGWAEALWFATSAEDPGQEAARSAIDNGADLIITAGGDGTVRAVAEAVRGTGTRMALLPSGTGNLLARNLELTLDDITHSVEVRSSVGHDGSPLLKWYPLDRTVTPAPPPKPTRGNFADRPTVIDDLTGDL